VFIRYLINQSNNVFMKIHKNNTQGIENNNKSSPSRYVSEHLRTQWEIATHNNKSATNLDHVQVTHTKSNIFKQKGWDFTNIKVKHIIHQLHLTIIKHHQGNTFFTFIFINSSSHFKYRKHLNFIEFIKLNNKGTHN